MNYYIWSIEHNQWWKPNGNGYTSNKHEAGVYTEEVAIKICEDANIGIHSLTSHRPDEAMVPAVGKSTTSDTPLPGPYNMVLEVSDHSFKFLGTFDSPYAVNAEVERLDNLFNNDPASTEVDGWEGGNVIAQHIITGTRYLVIDADDAWEELPK